MAAVRCIIGTIMLLLLLHVMLDLVASTNSYQILDQHSPESQSAFKVRKILSIRNHTNQSDGTKAGFPWERCEMELSSISPNGWLVHHLWWIFFFFVGLAIVCDNFFVPSLEAICEKLKLPEDVAGATFMAAGSSTPELFTSIMGVAEKTDVGVGAIVGSAAFNILVIISLTGALAGKVLFVDWRPMVRDIVFYALSILMFMGVAFDGWIVWYESLLLLVLYAIYCIVMTFNQRLMDMMTRLSCLCSHLSLAHTGHHVIQTKNCDANQRQQVDADIPVGSAATASYNGYNQLSSDESEEKTPMIPEQRQRRGMEYDHEHISPGYTDFSVHQADTSGNGCSASSDASRESSYGAETEGIALCPCSACPRIQSLPPKPPKEKTFLRRLIFVLRLVLYVMTFPYYVMFTYTIPDCSKENNKKLFMASFFISLAWITLLSFSMVTLVSRAGCILGVDEFTMGLILVAIGASVPDCLSSVFVGRNGHGSMAVSNAIGSNVFDIGLGLGLPFFVRILIQGGEPISLLDKTQLIRFKQGLYTIIPHVKFSLILLGILVCVLFSLFLSKFRLNKFISVTFLLAYFLFIAYSMVQNRICLEYMC